MRILVISNYRGLHTARPEAEIFVGLRALGHAITIMTYPDAAYIDRFESVGIRVIKRHPEQRYDRAFITFLRHELKQNDYDILQLYNNKAISNGIQAAKYLQINIVIYRGASSNMAWYNPINYLKFFHPRVDFVVCNSDEIRNNFLAVPGYREEKAVTILKGHDTTWYSGTQIHDIKSELSIPSEHLLFVTVANNRKFKAIPDLLTAMKYLPQGMNFTLLIIGRGMDTAKNLRLIKQSGRSEQIHLLGYRNDCIQIVAGCDAFILPSDGGESLTKSVVEAMSLGVVPVISDIEGNRPLVDRGINGFIFRKNDPQDLADTIVQVVNNRHVLPEFSKATQLKIDRDINSDTTVQRYAAFYESILGK